MGAKLSCLRLWRSSSSTDTRCDRAKSHYDTLASFDMLTEGCIELPANPMQGRTERIPPPQCLLTSHSFYALQKVLPQITQSMKLELVFSSWEHGFSKAALHRQVTDFQDGHGGKSSTDMIVLVKPAVTMTRRRNTNSSSEKETVSTEPIKDDETRSVVFGCYIPNGLSIGGPKRYYGSDGTFLFDLTQMDNQQLTLQRVCTVASPKQNEYYVSSPATGEFVMLVGGGGRGPAFAIDNGLEEVTTSTQCATFDKATYWPLLPKDDDDWEVEGVTVEGGEPKAPLSVLEIWRFSNERVAFPVME